MATDPGNIRFRPAKVNTDNKLYRSVRRCANQLVSGRVLAIDPSVGSSSSLPGYAIYIAGRLAEYGTIDIDISGSTYARLFELGRSLREDFEGEGFDVLVVEDIPFARYGARNNDGLKPRSLEAQIPLHRAVGAVLSNVKVQDCVAVAPVTWHSFAPVDYVKSDAGDAVCLGYVAIEYAKYAIEEAAKPRRSIKRRRTRKPGPSAA